MQREMPRLDLVEYASEREAREVADLDALHERVRVIQEVMDELGGAAAALYPLIADAEGRPTLEGAVYDAWLGMHRTWTTLYDERERLRAEIRATRKEG